MSASSLASLIPLVAMEQNVGVALERIADAAIAITSSRHAVIAVLNEDLGILEVTHGAGEDFARTGKGDKLRVDVGDKQGIVAFVAATGNTLVSGDVANDPHYRQMFATTRSELAVPVRGRHGRIIAVLNVESDRENAYNLDDQLACEALASLVGVVLDRAEQNSYEEALIQVGSALDAALTEEALIDRVIQIGSEVLRFQACSIFIHDPQTDSFVLRGTVGRLRDQIGKIRYNRGEGCTGWVCERGEPVILNHPQSDPRWRGKYVEFPSEQIASFLAVPILLRTKTIGAIRVVRRTSDNPYLDLRFTEGDLRVLQAIAEQFAVGLENLRSLDKIIRSERMIAWGELSAKSSHMIGNRVFAIKGDTNELGHLLTDKELDRTELQSIQQSLATNVMRIEEILQDFRDFVSATQLHLQFGDVNAVVHETAEEIFPKRSKVRLEMDLADDLPGVEIDAKKLRRAIGELIENSMNYMDEGTLRISTSVVDRTTRQLKRRFVQIEVEDSGPGVNEERKQIIFQPFHSGRVKGMGLGLSIVKGIIDAHGGEVYEDGQPTKGAKFVILLPASDRP
ncbi:MAG TPA: GAF domain-containing protein [Fimbriimonadaceae bacterium]|nr:GAF domain-containing protein [Fimbriimonadaceae bacterium]